MNKKIVSSMFPEEVERYESGRCTMCGGIVGMFRDEISEKEFEISGMCQACQDEVFDIDTDYDPEH